MNRHVRVMMATDLDVLAVVVFVLAGRRTHDEGLTVAGVAGVAAPFLIALAVGWVVLRAWRRPFDPAIGLGLAVITVALGMVLRNLAWDRGTATSFVIVAAIMVGGLLVAWRALATALLDRSPRHRPPTGGW